MRNKEQEILEAAEREFIAKGFAGARTTSIAEAAGVTHAMLHYYFRTKEQLFERILDEKMAAGIAAGGAAARRNRAAFRFHHGQSRHAALHRQRSLFAAGTL